MPILTAHMNTSVSLAALAPALSKAQAELQNAIKSSVNPAFSNAQRKATYADLTDCLDVIRPAFTKYGLSFVQGPELATKPDHVAVTTRLVHDSGEYIESTAEYPVSKKDAQGFVAATTYGRRCGIAAMSMLGLEDDDGNTAANTKPAGKAAPKAPAPAPKAQPAVDAAAEPAGEAKAVDQPPSTLTEDTDEPAAPKKKQTKKAAGASEEEVKALQAKFQAAKTKDDVTALVTDFTKLSPEQQVAMMPFAGEARKRAGL